MLILLFGYCVVGRIIVEDFDSGFKFTFGVIYEFYFCLFLGVNGLFFVGILGGVY